MKIINAEPSSLAEVIGAVAVVALGLLLVFGAFHTVKTVYRNQTTTKNILKELHQTRFRVEELESRVNRHTDSLGYLLAADDRRLAAIIELQNKCAQRSNK